MVSSKMVHVKKRFITSWLKAIEYFLYSYLGATALSFVLFFSFFLSFEFVRWILMMIFMPLFTYFLTIRYYKTVQHEPKESRRLGLFWLCGQVVFDFIIFIVITKFGFERIYWRSQPWLILGYIGTLLAPTIADKANSKTKKEKVGENWIGIK